MSAIKKVIEALRRRNNYLITSHINSEGDSIGSQVAMACLLRRLGKRYVIVDSDPIPQQLKFMLDGEKVKTRLPKGYKFHALISLDCPVVERTGTVAGYFKEERLIINIDHHISNTRFGDINWVESDMSSCGEMLYQLYKELGLKIDKKAALAMYVAILTDTGWFSYENTTAETHKVISELLKCGIKPLWVGVRINEQRSVNDLKLLKEALSTLQMHYKNRVVVFHTTKEMLRRARLKADSTEGFVNFGRSIKTAKIAVFFLENPDKPGEVHVSFRSKGEVDVNKVAKLFGGGGHPNASGCVIKGTIAQAKKIILPKIRKFL